MFVHKDHLVNSLDLGLGKSGALDENSGRRRSRQVRDMALRSLASLHSHVDGGNTDWHTCNIPSLNPCNHVLVML
jgi:hypothetical protein